MKHGRKTRSAYELYGFIPRVESGKHSAICKSCNRVLQKPAVIRLLRHRNACLAARANGKVPEMPLIETKKQKKQSTTFVAEDVQPHQDELEHNGLEHNAIEAQHEVVNSSIKMDPYKDDLDNMQDHVPSRKSTAKNANKINFKIKYFKDKSQYFLSELNNLKVEKTMMVLEAKKIRLEIEQLKRENYFM